MVGWDPRLRGDLCCIPDPPCAKRRSKEADVDRSGQVVPGEAGERGTEIEGDDARPAAGAPSASQGWFRGQLGAPWNAVEGGYGRSFEEPSCPDPPALRAGVGRESDESFASSAADPVGAIARNHVQLWTGAEHGYDRADHAAVVRRDREGGGGVLADTQVERGAVAGPVSSLRRGVAPDRERAARHHEWGALAEHGAYGCLGLVPSGEPLPDPLLLGALFLAEEVQPRAEDAPVALVVTKREALIRRRRSLVGRGLARALKTQPVGDAPCPVLH